MGIINPPLPTVGLSTSTEDAKTRTALSQIEDAVNNVTAAQLGDNVLTAAKLDDPPAWQTVALSASVFAAGSTLAFYKDLSSVVHFKSDVTYSVPGTHGANTVLGTLPAGFRPAVTHCFQMQGSLSPVVAVDADGTFRVHDKATLTGGATDWWFLIHYVALG